MALSKERKEKFKRIEELGEAGFNIPRAFLLLKGSRNTELSFAFAMAKEILKSSPDHKFNIRTYRYAEEVGKETVQTPHLTDLSFNELSKALSKVNSDYTCMIDAEVPDNGRIAGNILIEDKGQFTVEFVVKEKRAMVRDINSHAPLYSIVGKYKNRILSLDPNTSLRFPGLNSEEQNKTWLVIYYIIRKAFSLKKENIILEFTYFNIPSGIFYDKNDHPESYIVWWEFRAS